MDAVEWVGVMADILSCAGLLSVLCVGLLCRSAM